MRYEVNKDALRDAILSSGLTILEISKKANVHRVTIHNILNSDRKTNGYIVSRLAKALNIDAKKLIK